jgi:hypothetical protein
VVAEDVKDLDVWLDRLFRNGADVSISLQEPNPSFLAEGLLHRLVDATDGWVRPRALTIRLLVRDDVPDELTMVEKELSAIRSYYAEDELRIEIRRNELVSPEEIYILGDLITFSGPVFNPGSPAPTLYGHLPDSPSAGKRASAREAADTFESAWSAALPVA